MQSLQSFESFFLVQLCNTLPKVPSLVKTGVRPTMCHMQLTEDDVLWFTEQYTKQHVEVLLRLVAQLTTPDVEQDHDMEQEMGHDDTGQNIEQDIDHHKIPVRTDTGLGVERLETCQKSLEKCKRTPEEALQSDYIPHLRYQPIIPLPEHTKMESWPQWHTSQTPNKKNH